MKYYKSTRGKQTPLDFYSAILQGLGNDGGLLVPDFDFEKVDLSQLLSLDYSELATEIMSHFLPSDAKKDLKILTDKAYASGLFDKEVVKVKEASSVYIAELFHGQTAAFKDMALSLLPHFMTYSLKKKGEDREVLILAATSGDTGKAALEGFKDVEGTKIKVFYPIEGVSNIQKRQMITTTGNNVDVVGIEGNFDDAQRSVKEAFASNELKALCDEHHIFLSSANSINIGRLIPQIVYYFYSYLQLVKNNVITLGNKVNFTIPSGNFGNCLAGWIGKQMGLPVNKFIVASNKNNILTDFFQTGKYDTRREFFKTNAPAMDILVSSNLERLIYFFENKDSSKVNAYYTKLKDTGLFEIDENTFNQLNKEFYADYLNEKEVLTTIEDCFNDSQYVLDTHTACGYGVYKKYVEKTKDQTPTILLSTASPYKFPESVVEALFNKKEDVYTSMQTLYNQTHISIPKPLVDLDKKEVRHQTVIKKEEILSYIGNQIKGE